ncbi:MAG: thioredoxin family protein [SAR202 cluster bacterium]|nr:thioredoxin family protein [SAR202 cluster bacterium]
MLLLVLAALLACGSPSGRGPSEASPGPVEGPPWRSISSPDNSVSAVLATTVLRPGSQRLAFILFTSRGILAVPTVRVTPVSLVDNQPRAAVTAGSHPWPLGTKGSYSTHIDFDRPGKWRLDIVALDSDVSPRTAQIEVEVRDDYKVKDIGMAAPASKNKTLQDTPNLSKLTSGSNPNPDLYQTTIAQALKSGKPTLVVFASPAYCVSPTCGPEVETMQELKAKYPGRANFIHVEIYDNPHEVQGDLSRARLSPILREWGITTVPHWNNESWAFIISANGQIKARFEGYATLDELDSALFPELL